MKLLLSAFAALLLTPITAYAAPPATLADVAWLQGSWEGEGIEGAPALEAYAPAAGGQMVGHFRQLNKDGTVMFYELITIVEEGGSLAYRLKHFNADLTGWEEKGKVVSFPLIDRKPDQRKTDERCRADVETLRPFRGRDSNETLLSFCFIQ